MSEAEFCKRWFPLVVTCDGEKFPIEWFHTRGVARIAGKFVVSVYPALGELREPMEKSDPRCPYRQIVVSTWIGLFAEVVEHGVGSIDKELFRFDQYFSAQRPSSPAHNPRIQSGQLLSELFEGMAVILRDGYPGLSAAGLPELFWHNYEPGLRHQLLEPMARYIAHWL